VPAFGADGRLETGDELFNCYMVKRRHC